MKKPDSARSAVPATFNHTITEAVDRLDRVTAARCFLDSVVAGQLEDENTKPADVFGLHVIHDLIEKETIAVRDLLQSVRG